MIYQTPFGITDPVFSRDIGFYIFTLPGLAGLLGFLFGLVIISLVLLLPLYALRGDIFLSPWPVRFEPSAGSPSGHPRRGVVPAHHAPALVRGCAQPPLLNHRPARRCQLHRSVCAARHPGDGNARRAGGRDSPGRGPAAGSVTLGLWAVGGYVAVALLGRGLVPGDAETRGGADRAHPGDAVSQGSHRRHGLHGGSTAWASRELNGEADLTLADIRANSATIENVRLWDRDPLLQTFGQLQEIRTYYDFVSVDDDRYWIDGKYRQVLLSPRELNPRRSRPGPSSTST